MLKLLKRSLIKGYQSDILTLSVCCSTVSYNCSKANVNALGPSAFLFKLFVHSLSPKLFDVLTSNCISINWTLTSLYHCHNLITSIERVTLLAFAYQVLRTKRVVEFPSIALMLSRLKSTFKEHQSILMISCFLEIYVWCIYLHSV